MLVATDQLRKAVCELYTTFGGFQRPKVLAFCTHCHSENEFRRILTISLHELAPEDLRGYLSSALTTVGDADDFRYFMPRALELLAESLDPDDADSILGKLQYVGWSSWPARQQLAITAYLDAVWRAVLATRTEPSYFYSSLGEQWLSAFASAQFSLGRFLQVWEKESSSASSSHLVHFVLSCSRDLLSGVSRWELSPSAWSEVVMWLKSEPVAALLRGLPKDGPDAQLANESEEDLLIIEKSSPVV